MSSDRDGSETSVQTAKTSRWSPRVANFVNSVLGRDELYDWDTYYLGEDGAEQSYMEDRRRDREVKALADFNSKNFPALNHIDLNNLSSVSKKEFEDYDWENNRREFGALLKHVEDLELEPEQELYLDKYGEINASGNAEGVYLLNCGARRGDYSPLDFDLESVHNSVLGGRSDAITGSISEVTGYSDVDLFGTSRSTSVSLDIDKVGNGSYVRTRGSRGSINLDIGVIENDAVVEASTGRGDYRIDVEEIEEDGYLTIRKNNGGSVCVRGPKENKDNVSVVESPLIEHY